MNTPTKTISGRAILHMLVWILVIPLLPLLISWRWDWWEAWLYAAILILGFVISRLLVARRYPDLLAERARFMQHENIKTWDKWLSSLIGRGMAIVLLVAGLEALQNGTPSFGLWLKIISLVLIVGGFALGTYAMVENRFFSAVVRIQTDRDHQVVSGGPYRWMRHPGYAGGLITYLATPILLDSRWAFLPAVILAILVIARTALEDRTLQDELTGYREYAQRVRYRLLPGIW